MLNMILETLVCRTGSLVVGKRVVNTCGMNDASMGQTNHDSYSMHHPSDSPVSPRGTGGQDGPMTGIAADSGPGRAMNHGLFRNRFAGALSASADTDGPGFTGLISRLAGHAKPSQRWFKQRDTACTWTKQARRVGRLARGSKPVEQGRMSFAQG